MKARARCPKCGRFAAVDLLGDPICVDCELLEKLKEFGKQQDRIEAADSIIMAS